MRVRHVQLALLLVIPLLTPQRADAVWRVGLTAGGQWTSSSRTYPATAQLLGTPHARWEPGPLFGVSLSRSFRGLAIEADLLGTAETDATDFETPTISPPGSSIEFRAIEHRVSVALPVRVVFRLPGPFRLGIGPEVRYLARATAQSVYDSGAQPLASSQRTARLAAAIFEGASADITRNHQRWSWAAQGSFGLAWPMDRHEGRFDLRYAHGLSDPLTAADASVTPRGLQCVLGLSW